MDIHISNILKDLEKDNFQAYLLAQFTNIKYISDYKITRLAFCILKTNLVIYEFETDVELSSR